MAGEHEIPLVELYRLVESKQGGLSSREASRRLERFGPNELFVKKKRSELVKFLLNFTNFFAILLIIGAFLSFLAEWLNPGNGNLYIGLALIIVVVLNAVFTYLQEHQSERIMESFREMLPPKITVLRDGEPIKIESRLVVPGDVMLLEEGDKIPADGRLIEVNNLKVDNSALTGESEPQLRKLECTHKDILESRNMVFSGTLVQSGDGKAIVYSTGMTTQIGRIVQLTKEGMNVKTPLRKELNHFIRVISTIAIILGALFFIISVLMGKQLIGSLIFAIGIIVANVPEGLLPTVTLALSMASKRMAKKKALVKNLESVETLGSTTVICTDKTGTITENRMSVSTLVINNKLFSAQEPSLKKERGLSIFWAAMTLCNNARLNPEKSHASRGPDIGFTGDPTEGALLIYANRLKPTDKLKEQLPRIHETPFDSESKRMITTHHARAKRMNIAYLKGAPEVVIKKCSNALIDGKKVSFTPHRQKEIERRVHELASRGERVLAFAYKETREEKCKETSFTYIGLAGMLDPARPEVPDAITKCRTAGIRVFMVTGDYDVTAEAIARQVGLFTGDGKIVTGEEIERLSDQDLHDLLNEQELVFARTKPIQKLRIVETLRKKGEVVTVTGDGVNDAPALKNGDMGVAMGLSGTEVAKEASDMVLLDDNFATIVSAIEEGRTIFANIKKFIAYILTSNVPEILPFIAFAVFDWPLALTVVLILSIDLGTDLLPALGLGNERPESNVMKLPPRKRNERLLTKKLLGVSYGIIGTIQAIGGFTAFFTVLFRGGWTWGAPLEITNPLYMKATSAFFAVVVLCQVADVLICRTRQESLFSVGFFTNRLVNLGIFTELVLLFIIIYTPWLHPFFGTAPLGAQELLIAVPFMALTIIYSETRKWLTRRNNRFVQKYLAW